MAAKKNKKIRLTSQGLRKNGKKTAYSKTTVNSSSEKKLLLRKYDPYAWNEKTGKNGMVVEFKQDKISK